MLLNTEEEVLGVAPYPSLDWLKLEPFGSMFKPKLLASLLSHVAIGNGTQVELSLSSYVMRDRKD